MHPSLQHRGLLDFRFEGVEGAVGVAAEGADCLAVAPSAEDDCEGSVGVVLREGTDNCRVDDSASLSSQTVVLGSSGFPSSMSRLSAAGKLVEAERNSRTLEMVWACLTFSLMAVKEMLVFVHNETALAM